MNEKRAACVIGHISVKDPDKWSEYCSRVPATIAPWHAELVFRGKVAALLDGEHRSSDTVVLRFPDLAAVEAWYQSPAYQELIPLRREAADVDLISFEA